MGTFKIKKRADVEFQFNLLADNNQVILTSEGYTSKQGCEKGIESVRKNSRQDGQFEWRSASNGKSYFVLKAINGEVIGTSELYETEDGLNKGIASVKQNAPHADVVDQTI